MVRRISLAHGEGGELTHQLIQHLFIQSFGHQDQTQFDSAILQGPFENIAVTTDSFVVNPIFFPGGDIGKLAVTGTINDLAVSGAIPEVLTAGFIIEEGFPLPDLKKVVHSMAAEAEHAGVKVVAGDTKVVEKGSVDGLFINTTGIGRITGEHQLKPETIREGDAVMISGTIGDHGVSIMSARQELGLLNEVQSDCASLNHMIHKLMQEVKGIRIMRDPTRGGLATTLVELCEEFHCTVEVDELAIPIRDAVHGACDILGFDPLYLANEGKLVLIVDRASQQQALNLLNKHPLGTEAKVIGQVTAQGNTAGKLHVRTPIGTTRRLHRLSGMLLPRIC
ncbi:hydrogenase expression/formation protein HypE [Halobacillus andaensis]|uniref:Hydrogenase expression/formation protein HypE n=1 Tax=Halobacillus andaensis TaxID=1176239 RepID=A0A917B258_HALAA|nr:hydrogenase expression/formation protein HypE [Halobacillus andaensis]MBP2004824.1 hydrogenase expression/formation protein HypE [Halobacillus andaensis]GGF18617.1 hydrogenase expression/formation protein HypE [Halobacillus andaensis]